MTHPAAELPVRDWTVQDTVRLNGCELTAGTRLSILGERGSFRFLRYVTRPDGHCWLDVIGGVPGSTKFRSFRPDRVGQVESEAAINTATGGTGRAGRSS